MTRRWIFKIGVYTLEGGMLRFHNRTYQTQLPVTDAQAAIWIRYLDTRPWERT